MERETLEQIIPSLPDIIHTDKLDALVSYCEDNFPSSIDAAIHLCGVLLGLAPSNQSAKDMLDIVADFADICNARDEVTQ